MTTTPTLNHFSQWLETFQECHHSNNVSRNDPVGI